jgi:hypothetical protein
VSNKLTADVKACIIAAFNDAGGREYLVRVAKKDPSPSARCSARNEPFGFDLRRRSFAWSHRYRSPSMSRSRDAMLQIAAVLALLVANSSAVSADCRAEVEAAFQSFRCRVGHTDA